MRILILSQWCYPEPDAKALVFAKKLSEKGHSVQVLTGFPNYPGGKIYPGYKIKFRQKEIIDGIEILRVPLYPDHSNSAVKRFFNYISFALTASLWGVFWIKKADVMYVYHPPATIAIPALFIRLFRRIPVVYDIQDLWPDTLSSTGMLNSPIVLWLTNLYCKLIYRLCDHLVVLSPGFKEKLIARKVPENKISVVYNWTVLTHIPEKAERSLIPLADKKFTILFAGTMGKAQALDTVLEAASILQAKGVNDIQFAFIGGGIAVADLKQQSETMQLKNMQFLPRVTADKIGAYLLAADVLLVHLMEDPLFKITIPSKTQAYMQVGKPILMAVGGNADALVNEAQAGICCSPENAPELAESVIRFSEMSKEDLETLGRNGKKFYDERLSIERGTDHFLEIFKRVAHV